MLCSAQIFLSQKEGGEASWTVADQACTAALCSDGVYTGTYPHPATVDNYESADLDKAENGYGD